MTLKEQSSKVKYYYFGVFTWHDPRYLAKSLSLVCNCTYEYIPTSLHDDVMFSFVAVDATPKPGPKKVFNFLGQLTEDEVMDSGQH